MPTFYSFLRVLRPAYGALVLLLSLTSFSAFAQTGIGTSTPNPKAALDVTSTDKGLLVPRLTSAQRHAIGAPPQGLMVFQTGPDSVGFWYATGTNGQWLFLPDKASAGDNLGNHTATQNLNLGTNRLVGVGSTNGFSLTSQGFLNMQTPNDNLAIGRLAGSSGMTGFANVLMGYVSGLNLSSGYINTAIGTQAGRELTSGYNNTLLGYDAGRNQTTGFENVFVGGRAGFDNVTGNSLTMLGAFANVGVDGLSKATAIGYGATVSQSNSLVLGGTGSNSVNVGIGTTTPQAKLEVAGAETSQHGLNAALILRNTAATPANLWYLRAGGPGTDTPNGGFSIADGTNYMLSITSGGQLGVLTSSPIATLDVMRGTATNGTAVFRGTTRFSHFNYSTAEDTYIRGGKSTSNVLLNDNGGNVGVGTSSPQAKLDVNGNQTIEGTLGINTSDGDKLYLTNQLGVGSKIAHSTGWSVDYYAGPGNQNQRGFHRFFTTDNATYQERMRIDNLGQVGIGTTSPTATLHVGGATSSVRFEGLAGTGTRVLTADANGNLATTAVTSLGDNLGSHSATQALTMNGNAVNFGTMTKQMLNLYATDYGIGVQGGTTYQRSGGNFAWFKGGSHSDNTYDPGAGGSVQMVLSSNGYLGLGTTNPQATLDLTNGSGAATAIIRGTNRESYFNWGGNQEIYLRAGTASGSVNINDNGGNVGVGRANPEATLDVARGTAGAGSLLVRGTDRWTHFNYDVAEDTYIRGGKATSNIYLNDNGGNVGVGTTTPTAKFEVNGTTYLNGNTTIAGATRLQPMANGGTRLLYVDNNGDVAASAGLPAGVTGDNLGNHSATQTLQMNGNPITFGGTTGQFIDLWGGVYGIGVQPFTNYQRSDFNFAWYRQGSHVDNASDPGPGGSLLMFLDWAGRLGIGTSSPGEKLDVAGNANVSSNLSVGGNGYVASSLGVGISPQATLDVARGTSGNGAMLVRGTDRISHFNYSTTEDTYIRGGKNTSNIYLNDNGGNVGIGTANPQARLDVNGTVLVQNTATFNGSAIVNGNTGLGTTTPQARLDVNGGVLVRNTNVLEFGAGVAGKDSNAGKIGYQTFSGNALDIVGAGASAADRRVQFWAEAGLGVYGPTTFGGNMTVSGNLGVLTNNPQAALHVAGNARIDGLANGGNRLVTVDNSGNLVATSGLPAGVTGDNLGNHTATQDVTINSNKINFGTSTRQMLNLYGTQYGIGVQDFTTYQRSDGNFAWFRNGSHSDSQLDAGGGTVQMVLTSGGNLGIGTASPTQKLDVNGNANVSSNATVGGNLGVGTSTPQAKLDVNGSALVNGNATISSNATVGGLLGVGTTSPQAPLDVNGNVLVGGTLGINTGDGDKIYLTNGLAGGSKISHSSGWSVDYNAGPGNSSTQGLHRFFTTSNGYVERMRIDNLGQVGIGTTSPTATLHVGGATSSVRLEGLGGNGSRMLTTDNSGNLSTQPLPTDAQILSVSGGNLTISNGNSVPLTSLDAQQLTKTGSTISLTNGGAVTDDDNQNLSLSGANLSISGGTGVTLPDADATNELQTISKSGSTVTLSNGGGSFTDDDSQTLSISGSTISLTNGGSVTVPSSADNWGAQVVQTTGTTLTGNGTSASPLGIQTASAAQAGALSAADWTTFNSKVGGATNGLAVTGGNVGLGGTLTGATTIVNGGNNLSVTGTGNVGIGIASPTVKLDVGGALGIDTGDGDKIYLTNGLSNGSKIAHSSGWSVDYNAGPGNTSTQGMHRFFTTSNGYAERMRIDNAGNVGIGTTSPAQKLDVTGNTNVTGNSYVSGQVGIGTTSPAAKLDIQGGADAAGANDPYALAFSWRNGGYRHWVRSRHNNAVTGAGNDLDFYVNNSTVSTTSSAPGTGNIHVLTMEANNSLPRVGIGTTTPSAALDVNGATRLRGLTTAGLVTTDASGNLGSATAASLDPTTASNGLTKTGSNFALGGTLTGATTIAQASNFFALTGGQVGIGTATSAGSRLSVASSSTAEPGLTVSLNGASTAYSLKLEHNGSNFIVRPATAGGTSTVVENTGGGALVLNPSGGNVAIGSTNSAATLDVAGTVKLGTNGTPLAAVIKTSGVANINVANNGTSTYTFSVANAITSGVVYVSPATALADGLIVQYARVSAAGTVEIKLHNRSGAAQAPGNTTFYITVIQ